LSGPKKKSWKIFSQKLEKRGEGSLKGGKNRGVLRGGRRLVIRLLKRDVTDYREEDLAILSLGFGSACRKKGKRE